MNMQRSTATRLAVELNAALETTTGDLVPLSAIAKTLIYDAIARHELEEAIEHESTDQ